MTATLVRLSDVEAAPSGLAVDRLTKRYDRHVALDGVALDCPRGGVTVVVGPSGCGKTSLLRCVAGLEEPSAGSIRILGVDATTAEPRRRRVAMVFQNAALYPAKTVAENIAFPLRMARVPRAERRRRVAAAAELTRIGELLDRRPHELSGGQRQRVGIARAVVRDPAVLLLDEPLSHLDAQLRTEMRAELADLQRRLGTTVVHVTHDQTEALTLAEHLVVMNCGRVEQAGTPLAVFDRPATTFVAGFLGAMNLLPGTIGPGPVLRVAPGHDVRLPHGLPAPAGGFGHVGVRPEHLAVGTPAHGELGASGRVLGVELLGTEKLVRAAIGPAEVRVRVPAATPVGDRILLRAAAADVHVFDGDGSRL